MKTETMSIHRALAELKLIDSKISNELIRAKFAGFKKVSGKTIDNLTVEEFKSNSKASLQAINDLIKRRASIKSALVLSNATTKVNVAGEEMTVAEAIDKKNTTASMTNLITKLKQTWNQTHVKVDRENRALDDEALLYFQEITQNKDKLNEAQFKTLISAYKDQRELEVVEGFDVRKEGIKLEDELNEFLTNVDFVLSESNTETKIEFSY